MNTAAPSAGAANGRLAEQMEKIVLSRIGSDQLVLPPMPAVAIKCLALSRTPSSR